LRSEPNVQFGKTRGFSKDREMRVRFIPVANSYLTFVHEPLS
jgi:hypothetical protein